MTTLALAWRYLWSRPLGAALNLLLLSLGLASITFLLLLGHQLGRAFERDLAGIDLVVGAKGSPLQLILSGVLHLDVPTGNVSLQAVRELEKTRWSPASSRSVWGTVFVAFASSGPRWPIPPITRPLWPRAGCGMRPCKRF